MPTGQETIVWTAANDERLLLSILAVHNIKVDAPSVAKVFGNDIAASVIQTRMKKLKAKARALNPGVIPTDAVVSTATKHSREITKASSGTARKKVKQESTAHEGDVNGIIGTQDNTAHDLAVTPPATPGKKTSTFTKSSKLSTPSPKVGKGDIDHHVQAKRCSPRNKAKPNYCQLDDPFVYSQGDLDEDESNVFDQVTDLEGEDSLDSDKNFDAEEVSTEA